MSAIADWLASLGMSEYAERFAKDHVDFDVLGELTDQDFDRLGVSVGHRRRMLKAIRERGDSAPATPQVATAAPAGPQVSAERRQLTVMFCDLVGSTALSGRLDPEDLRRIIGAYHRCCAELIDRDGGFVAKYMGDGVLSYFGYPHAHEHDAKRAVRTGLPKLTTAAHALASARRHRDGSRCGRRPDRLGRSSRARHRRRDPQPCGALFELEDLGPKDLKGIAGPARAWIAILAAVGRGCRRRQALSRRRRRVILAPGSKHCKFAAGAPACSRAKRRCGAISYHANKPQHLNPCSWSSRSRRHFVVSRECDPTMAGLVALLEWDHERNYASWTEDDPERHVFAHLADVAWRLA